MVEVLNPFQEAALLGHHSVCLLRLGARLVLVQCSLEQLLYVFIFSDAILRKFV